MLSPLIHHGVDINLADNEGTTALDMAIMIIHPALVEYLLMKGANPNLIDKKPESLLDELYFDLSEEELKLKQLKKDEFAEIARRRDYIRRYKVIIGIMEDWGAKGISDLRDAK